MDNYSDRSGPPMRDSGAHAVVGAFPPPPPPPQESNKTMKDPLLLEAPTKYPGILDLSDEDLMDDEPDDGPDDETRANGNTRINGNTTSNNTHTLPSNNSESGKSSRSNVTGSDCGSPNDCGSHNGISNFHGNSEDGSGECNGGEMRKRSDSNGSCESHSNSQTDMINIMHTNATTNASNALSNCNTNTDATTNASNPNCNHDSSCNANITTPATADNTVGGGTGGVTGRSVQNSEDQHDTLSPPSLPGSSPGAHVNRCQSTSWDEQGGLLGGQAVFGSSGKSHNHHSQCGNGRYADGNSNANTTNNDTSSTNSGSTNSSNSKNNSICGGEGGLVFSGSVFSSSPFHNGSCINTGTCNNNIQNSNTRIIDNCTRSARFSGSFLGGGEEGRTETTTCSDSASVTEGLYHDVHIGSTTAGGIFQSEVDDPSSLTSLSDGPNSSGLITIDLRNTGNNNSSSSSGKRSSNNSSGKRSSNNSSGKRSSNNGSGKRSSNNSSGKRGGNRSGSISSNNENNIDTKMNERAMNENSNFIDRIRVHSDVSDGPRPTSNQLQESVTPILGNDSNRLIAGEGTRPSLMGSGGREKLACVAECASASRKPPKNNVARPQETKLNM